MPPEQLPKIFVRSKAVSVGDPEEDPSAMAPCDEPCSGVGGARAPCGFQPADLLVRDGRGYRIVGRESDLINVAGRKVNPVEIEQVLAQFPGVDEAVVCGGADSARGEGICALVAAQLPPDPHSLRRHCAGLLVSWKIPRRFVFVKEVPRNARGKISRLDVAATFFPDQDECARINDAPLPGRKDFDRNAPGKP